MHMVNEQGEDEKESTAGADRIDKNKQSIIKLFFLYTHWKEKSRYLVWESRNMANLNILFKKKEESGHLFKCIKFEFFCQNPVAQSCWKSVTDKRKQKALFAESEHRFRVLF